MTHQLRGPSCSHGYTVYAGKHPNGRPCTDAQLTGSDYVRAVVDQLIALDVPVDVNALDLDEEQCNIPIADFVKGVYDRLYGQPDIHYAPPPAPPPDTSWLRTTQPRRRWWHRYTRRAS